MCQWAMIKVPALEELIVERGPILQISEFPWKALILPGPMKWDWGKVVQS